MAEENTPNVTQYPNADFQKIYEGIINSMGTDDQLRANLEAALRPMYEQSKAELEQQRRANNAAIDVDAFSRGMGNSTWTTDAKLQNLRNAESKLASLGANYNNALFTNLMNAIADRDDKAYNQAMTWWQLNQKGKGGSGSASPDWLQDLLGKTPDVKANTSLAPNNYINDILNPPKGVKAPNRAIVNPWNYTKLNPNITQYTK